MTPRSATAPRTRRLGKFERPHGVSEILGSRTRQGLLNFSPLGLVPVVPALLRYSKSSKNSVVQKRGNHPDKQDGGLFQQARQESMLAKTNHRFLTGAAPKHHRLFAWVCLLAVLFCGCADSGAPSGNDPPLPMGPPLSEETASSAETSTASDGSGASADAKSTVPSDEPDRLRRRAEELAAKGNFAEAAESVEQAIVIERKVLRADHSQLIKSCGLAASYHEAQNNWDNATRWQDEALRVATAAYGAEDWRTTDVRVVRQHIERMRMLSPDECQELRESIATYDRIVELHQSGQYIAAVELATGLLRIRERILGEGDPNTAEIIHTLAELHRQQGNYLAAEAFSLRSLKINEKVLGSDHPATAGSIYNLALVYEEQGRYAVAEPLFQRSLRINANTLGPDHWTVANSLNELALLHQLQANYAAAEPLFQQSLKIREKTLGLEHIVTAGSYNNLAGLYQAQGNLAASEPLYQRSLLTYENTLGHDHPETAEAANNLASVYVLQGNYAAAEPLFKRSLKIFIKTFGDDHRRTGEILNNIALVYKGQKRYAEAERLLHRSLSILEESLGEENISLANTLDTLGGLHQVQRNYSAAQPLYQRSLTIVEKAFGPDHPKTASSIYNHALSYVAQGNDAEAQPLLWRSLQIQEIFLGPDHAETTNCRASLALCEWRQQRDSQACEHITRATLSRIGHLEQSAAIQTEQQQFLMTNEFKGTLSGYVALLGCDPTSSRQTWQTLLAWKGLITARQTRLRQLLKNDSRYTEFRVVSQQLSTHALNPPQPPNDPQKIASWNEQAPALRQRWEERKAALEAEHVRIEKEIARKWAAFRATIEQRKVTSQDLQKLLAYQPEPTALVDLFEYFYIGRLREPNERRIVAFVVRGDGEVVRVELGAAKAIHELVKSWRETFGAGKAAQAAGQQLREKLWQPLSPHLAGIKIVVLSPDGALAQLPWGALPGEKPGSYLLEDVALAVIPVPQMLPELLKAVPNSDLPSSLLLAGDIDYGGDPGAVSPSDKRDAVGRLRDGKLFEFTRLPAGQAEMVGIEKRYQPKPKSRAADVLRGSAATEAAFCEQARQHAWLHLITHGYFAPETVRSALAPDPDEEKSFRFQFHSDRPRVVKGEHPGLLSGLAFAGANTPPAPGHDDGILTALEVSALDLSNVDGVVLSACETGLGEVAGGEGLLGLQRAFQVAGAKTVVASLWKVPDAETSLLMQLFYENVWEKKLPRLEALRQAQLQLLHNYDAQSHTLRGTVGKLKPPIDPAPTDPANKTASRCPPFFWAAFVLSGDWR